MQHRFRPHTLVALLRPGDYLVIAGALLLCAVTAVRYWGGARADTAVVRAGGAVVARLPLAQTAQLTVAGPLGPTRIEVQPGRARVAADPGPRQYCVRQGWLSRPGAVAICAPNQVSLSLEGDGPGYDSLGY